MYSARLFVTFFPRNQQLSHKDHEIPHLAAAHHVLIYSLPRWNKLDQRVLSLRTQTERKKDTKYATFLLCISLLTIHVTLRNFLMRRFEFLNTL